MAAIRRCPRILLVTGQQALEMIADAARDARRILGCDTIDVVALPVPVAGLITTTSLVRSLPRVKPDYRKYDVIMVPGLSSVDPLEASKMLGVRVVKGPKSPGDIIYVLRDIIEGGERNDYSNLATDIREVVDGIFSRAEKKCIGMACIRMHPAYTLVVEVTPDTGKLEDIVQLVKGAKPDFIVLGDEEWLSDEEYRGVLAKFADLVDGVPFGVETRRVDRMIEALERGAKLVAGVSIGMLSALRRYRDSAFFTLIPLDEERKMFPRDPSEKIRLLTTALKKAWENGFESIILDPIVVPPPYGFVESIEAYRLMREAVQGKRLPLLFSLASLEDAVPTDAFHIYLLGGLIGYELEASVYWVVAKRGVEPLEARAALDVALASYVKKDMPRNLGLDLTLLGLGSRPAKWKPERGEVIRVDREVPPSRLDRGYARIGVDDGEIIVEYVDLASGRRRIYRGRDGLSIARLIVRDFNVNPEHAAYLGYELAKAEIAALLYGGYIQDEKLLPPYLRLLRR